jgi:2-polyprenyl-6-methoxyphenol hydroxylase-like FAD-dependent oxidoreductase
VSTIVVCGGSMIGLSSAMLLARDGHDVTVLERDPAPPPPAPREAWEAWDRKGVPQFHQPHNLFPRVREILDDELPGMVDQLVEAGCVWWGTLELLPPSITDHEPRAGDDRFRFVTGRRPVAESVFASAAEEMPGVTVRRGVTATELLTGAAVVDGAPHISGVRTSDGDVLQADLVIDAMGRRSPLVDWLAALGARAPQVESEEHGFVYYTRYFAGPDAPPMIGPPLAPMGTFSLLTLPGDNDTWSITIWAAAADAVLRKVRAPGEFTKVLQACPFHAHWLNGEPITDVLAMASILDKYRRFVVDGQPIATGVAAVGDAWACTNPSAGRGISVGLFHAQCLRDATRVGLDDPEAFVRAFDELTETKVAPYFWNQINDDKARIAEMDALREGEEPPPPDPTMTAFLHAAMYDADVFRGMLEMRLCLALPQEILARPGFLEKIDACRDAPAAMAIPAPSRTELVALLS